MTDNLIPFGKHKGKPIEILAEDKEYAQWLLAQPWFKAKYLNIYTVVINNFHEPAHTPEHNVMQNRFLDQEYSLKLAYCLDSSLFKWNSEQINKRLNEILIRSRERDVETRSRIYEDRFNTRISGLDNKKLLTLSKPIFEGGHDVAYYVRYGVAFMTRSIKIHVEIKPSVSENYPSVLRQMKHPAPSQIQGVFDESFRCLLVRDYVGEGVNREQFVQFFESQHFRVIFASDVDNACLPHYDEVFKMKLS